MNLEIFGLYWPNTFSIEILPLPQLIMIIWYFFFLRRKPHYVTLLIPLS